MFNPNLSGYSTGTGEFISSKARLNIAFPVAATEDALQQARILVQRIKSDPKVDVRRQWKVLARNCLCQVGLVVCDKVILQILVIFNESLLITLVYSKLSTLLLSE